MPHTPCLSVRRGLIAAVSLLALSACGPRVIPAPITAQTQPQAAPPPVRSVDAPPPVYPIATPRALISRIQDLGRGFDGKAGIAVRHVQSGWVTSYNGAGLFPQQSVSKLWVAMTVLDAVDRGTLRLDDPVTVRKTDLTVFHQPIRALIGKDGYRTTIGDLLEMALTKSDNTANDMLLKAAGGPDAIRGFVARKRLGAIRFGPGERKLQAGIAGLDWKPEYANAGGQGFLVARSKLSLEARKTAIEAYVDDPVDGAAPLAITDALGRLWRGELLSPASTAYLLKTMGDTSTGAARLKAGIAKPWILAHKTGTGQELGSLATGFNDIGLMTAPDGQVFAVAVMIGASRAPIAKRQQLIADVARAIVSLHDEGQLLN